MSVSLIPHWILHCGPHSSLMKSNPNTTNQWGDVIKRYRIFHDASIQSMTPFKTYPNKTHARFKAHWFCRRQKEHIPVLYLGYTLITATDRGSRSSACGLVYNIAFDWKQCLAPEGRNTSYRPLLPSHQSIPRINVAKAATATCTVFVVSQDPKNDHETHRMCGTCLEKHMRGELDSDNDSRRMRLVWRWSRHILRPSNHTGVCSVFPRLSSWNYVLFRGWVFGVKFWECIRSYR